MTAESSATRDVEALKLAARLAMWPVALSQLPRSSEISLGFGLPSRLDCGESFRWGTCGGFSLALSSFLCFSYMALALRLTKKLSDTSRTAEEQ